MVFYYFGPDPSSWALGNERFSWSNNLPSDIQAVWDELGAHFQDKQMAGTQIMWMSTAPDGRYAVMTRKGDLLSNVPDLLNAVNTQLHQVYGTGVEHVCLSPLGGWLITYSLGTVTISGRFPDSFYALASPYLDVSSTQRQRSVIEYVFFGADEGVVIKTRDDLIWEGIHETLAEQLTILNSPSYALNKYLIGRNTALCTWAGNRFFLEAKAKAIMSQQVQYPYSVLEPSNAKELMDHIVANSRPPAPLISTLKASIPEKPSPSQHTHQRPPPSTPAPQQYGETRPPAPSPAPRTQSTNPFLTDHEENSSTISASARRRFEEKFNLHSEGRLYINGVAAAQVMLESGLDSEVLSEIWDLVDLDKNGKLDKEEFILAMWHIEARQGGTQDTQPIIKTAGVMMCDGCSRGLAIGEVTYSCSVCNGGDFDLCQSCYSSGGHSCPHQLTKVLLQLQGNLESRYIFGAEYATCDGCSTQLPVGTNVYWCRICNGGDYDICDNCWKLQQTCGHSLLIRKLERGDPSANSSEEPGISHGMPPSSSFSQLDLNGAPEWPSSTANTSESDKYSKDFNDKKLKDSLMNSILTEKPNVKWDDVAGLESAKGELQEAIVFPARFPHIFQGKRRARRALLLYGPPGTGKSYLAKAVATEVDQTLFSISSSDVMSKWFGESEGLVRQLFKLAREKKPSIIFIDEIDAICGNRDSGASNAEDTARMKTEFLVQMDGVGNNNDGVFVLAATNLPWALDPALRRRFQKRIHVPLPDESARRALFKVHLGEMSSTLGDTERAFADLAARTEGFSGSDIANLVQDGMMMPVKKIHTATHFRKYRDRNSEWWTPCNPGDFGATPMKWNQVPAKQLKEPPLTIRDLYEAVSKVKPSVGEEEVRKCQEWTQQYGLEGA